MSDSTTQPKKKRKMLTSFSIILIILAIVALVTVFMNGMTVTDAEGAEAVITGATLPDFLMAPVKGFGDAIDVCLFVLVLGGFLGIVNKTDALNAGITKLVKKMGGNELKLIPILMAIFAIMGSTYGFCEESVGFYALLAATMMAAGFDALTGAMMVLLGAGVGCLGSTVNPFATGIASSALTALDIPIDQGIIIAIGLVLLVVTYIIAVFFVIQYAKRVKADPKKTLMSESELAAADAAYSQANDEAEDVPLSGRQKAVLVVFTLTFIVMIIGFIPWQKLGVDIFNAGSVEGEPTITEVTKDNYADTIAAVDEGELEFTSIQGTDTVENVTPGWSAFLTGTPLGDWYFAESTTWFLLMAIIIGIIGGLSEHEIVDEFMAGVGDIVSVVMIIAVSRGVSVLMSSTGLANFVLYSASNALAGTSGVIFAPLSFLLYFALSFLIPSTSGMATVSMPIMGPLCASLGFNPAIMIMIFSAASGVVNLITPTNGAIMGGLALARVEYPTWVKFATKIVVIMSVVCIVILTVAMMVVPA